MREILFRARWRDTNIIIQDFSLEYTIDSCNDEKIIVEQFIGLTDKNGIKIFEGDIVKANFPYAKIGFVEFDKKRCSFYVKPIDGFAAYDKGYKMNANKLEVIGNIHANNF